MFRPGIAALLLVAAAAWAADVAPAERARIDYLLQVIGSMHDAKFIRNGQAYDSADAVAHLRTKLRAAASRVHSAEDFIRYCASESSVTGTPYEIRFADGHVVRSADFLTQKLLEFDADGAR